MKTEICRSSRDRSFYNEKGQLFKERNRTMSSRCTAITAGGAQDTVAVRTDASKQADALDYARTTV